MTSRQLQTWSAAITNFHDLAQSVEDWSIATPCPGWSIADLVSHTIDLESMLAADPRPEHSPDWAALPHVESDFGRLTEIGVDYRRGRSRDELLAELTDAHARALARIESLPPDASIPWLRGDTPIPRLLGMRTFDVWVHEQDARVAAGMLGNLDGPGAAEAMQYLGAGLPKVWGKGVGAPAKAVLHVVISEPGLTGDFWVRMGEDGKAGLIGQNETDGDADVTVTVPWPSFVMLGGGRATQTDYARDVVVVGDQDLGRRFLESMAVTP